MKKLVYSIIILNLIFFSCKNEAEENYEDINKVKIGMTYEKVKTIMRNDPLEITDAYWADTLFIYNYKPVFASSDHYKIIFSKRDSLVVDIGYGD